MSAKKNQPTDTDQENTSQAPSKQPICGIVRPIAALDNYTESHWQDVHNILCEAITKANFKPNLVSNANEVNLIHKTIIENLYLNEIVICDISGKNPNVMLELGMRLAFDKPTIIVKDDATSYSFDTSPIQHLEYRRDLRFADINRFQRELTDKIIATHEKSTSDPSYSTFLKNFGSFKVAQIDQVEASGDEIILEKLRSIELQISNQHFFNTIRPSYRSLSEALGVGVEEKPQKIKVGFQLTEPQLYTSLVGQLRHLTYVKNVIPVPPPPPGKSGINQAQSKLQYLQIEYSGSEYQSEIIDIISLNSTRVFIDKS